MTLGATALSLCLLTSCNEEDDPVTADDLRSALLVSGDLSDDFTVAQDDGDEVSDELEWGCLFDFEKGLEEAGGDDEGVEDITVSLEAEQEPGMPGIVEFLVLSDTEDDAKKGLSTIADMISSCHSVDSEDDGTHWQFSVDSDRVAWANGVDQQVNMTASGTVGLSGLEIPVSMTFSLMRVERVTVMVLFMDLASDVEEARRDVIRVAMSRVTAAMEGEEQPEPAGVLDDYPIGREFGTLLQPPTGV